MRTLEKRNQRGTLRLCEWAHVLVVSGGMFLCGLSRGLCCIGVDPIYRSVTRERPWRLVPIQTLIIIFFSFFIITIIHRLEAHVRWVVLL